MTTETEQREYVNDHDLRSISKAAGQHYFDPDTMRFFSSRLMSDLFHGERYGVWGVYFVTSERDTYRDSNPRMYSVRFMALDAGEWPDPHRPDPHTRPVERGHVYNASAFQAYASRSGALKAAERYAKTGGAELDRTDQ